jgi:hypothetical protein
MTSHNGKKTSLDDENDRKNVAKIFLRYHRGSVMCPKNASLRPAHSLLNAFDGLQRAQAQACTKRTYRLCEVSGAKGV